MTVTAIVQARLGSTRLPGKTMMPLGGKVTVTRVLERLALAETLDEIVLATTTAPHDALLVDRAKEVDVEVHRGSEDDVLQRYLNAAEAVDATHIARVAGDCPLTAPSVVDHAVDLLLDAGADYVTNKIERTFPLGLDVEVFTMDTFETVATVTEREYYREHVSTYYLDKPKEFDRLNFTSDAIFEDERYHDRTDLEFVIDEAPDYRFLNAIFKHFQRSDVSIQHVIDYADEEDLTRINAGIQRTHEKEPDT